MEVFLFIISVIIGIVVWALYHKLFNVTYFSGNAFFKELMVCWIIGVLITSVIKDYWFLVVGALVVIWIVVSMRKKK